MKFPGKLEAGLQSGVLTEAKYIKGTYIVFTTITERNKFTSCGCKEVLVKGAKCYVASEKQEYRWDGSKWIPLQTDTPVAPVDGKIYGIQNGQWVEIDVAGLNKTVEEISKDLNSVEQSVTTLQGKVEYNTNMVNYLNKEFNNKADKSDIPTKVSDLENDLDFITLTAADAKFTTIENFNNLEEDFTYKVGQIDTEIEQLQDSVTDLEKTAVRYTTLTSSETTTIATTTGKIGNSVDIDDPTTPSLTTSNDITGTVQVTRKTIQLDNYDSISGLDTEGENHSLAMVSKENIAEFGDSNLHLNLNTKDNVTINGSIVLTTEDKTELEDQIQQIIGFDLNDYYKKSETYNKEEVDNLVTTSVGNAYQDIQDVLTLYPKSEDVTNEIQEAVKDLATTSSVEELKTDIDNLNQSLELITINVNNKQDKLVSEGENQNIKTINGQSILGNGDITISSYNLPVATKDALGGIKSGTYESDEGTLAAVVVDDEGNANVRIPPLEQFADQQDVVDILNSGVGKILVTGGNASD